MTDEERLKKAEQLAKALRRDFTIKRRKRGQEVTETVPGVDDNEVKKAFGFLCRVPNLAELHRFVKALPGSAFAGRSQETPGHYRRMKEEIPQHLPADMDAEDALWILGWAARLLKYEAAKGDSQ